MEAWQGSLFCLVLVLTILALGATAASNKDAPTKSTQNRATHDDVPMGCEGCLVGMLLIGFGLFAVFAWFVYNK